MASKKNPQFFSRALVLFRKAPALLSPASPAVEALCAEMSAMLAALFAAASALAAANPVPDPDLLDDVFDGLRGIGESIADRVGGIAQSALGGIGGAVDALVGAVSGGSLNGSALDSLGFLGR
ncbi:hypothetical protein EVAR_33648_1 [Eumeta japonica]|uniref:Uncharacterized protein n=1 Tax=Eumeta variegata TaxID=151549 RepID=A0A4C1VQJ8_EUMVA|nr:hypothetical protein EVAR_33648_1 [Eumeta japonica]